VTTLDYGRQSTARRRAARWAILATFFVVAAIAGRYAAVRIEHHFARRTAEEQLAKWFTAARAATTSKPVAH
jgi:hypothetical protein